MLDIKVPSSSSTLYGVTADYTFWRKAYLGASYYELSEIDDSFTSVRLGWKLHY